MVNLTFPIQILIILIFSVIFKVVLSDVFSAVVKLEYLIKMEKRMLDALDTYIVDSQAANYHVPDSAITFLAAAREKNQISQQPHYIENPINAFHFLKRMTHNWTEVLNAINCDDCIQTRASDHLVSSLSVIRQQFNVESGPGEIDILGTAIGLVRLWHTYNLDLAALFSGRIFNTVTDPLTPDDIYYICRSLEEEKMYYKEILWLRELVNQAESGFYKGIANPARPHKALAGAYFSYGMPWKSEEILNKYSMKDPENKSVQRDKKYYGQKAKSIPPEERTVSLQPPPEDINRAHYEALCRGDVVRPVNVTSSLKCFLKPTAVPILFAKEEVLNYDPRVSMYYDVITETEQELLKSKGLDKFVRSTIIDENYGSSVSRMRVSQTAWLHDDIDPRIRRFTHRVQLFTGLSTEMLPCFSHAEELQILNYGIGGMYEPHPDYFGYPLSLFMEKPSEPPILQGTGDRIATWLTYLNPVKAGGATVFLDLNITVPVVKGAAAFWYNMKRNGELDSRTTHAGCPVLIGSKWAVVKLEHLIKVEQRMIDALGRYMVESIESYGSVPDSVVTFLATARERNEAALKPHYIENPINAFHFLRRMTLNWTELLGEIQCDECSEMEPVKNFRFSLDVIHQQYALAPEADVIDIEGTAIALVRLWHTYKLDLAALFRGEIYNTTTDPLSPDDVYYICQVMANHQMYYREIMWLEEFVNQIEEGFYKGKTNPARAYKALAAAYFAYGMPWKSEEILDQYLKTEPDNKLVLRDKIYFGLKTKEIPPDQRQLTLQAPQEDSDKRHYEALCRGDIRRPLSVTSRLKCFLKPTEIPVLFAKEEVLNYDPRIVLLYDVITESEQLFLKNKVLDRFERSTIVGEETDRAIDNMRVSETAWVHDNEDPVVRKYTYRIQLFTGLSTELHSTLSHAEELQVLNYGIGGMYEPHPDWFGYPLYKYPVSELHAYHPALKESGERLATWLAYLNPVEAGGATIFLDLNITIPVVKGAAAFWYNLRRNGECDTRTWHAGCPVLIGSKWAANKWIRETGNLFRRKCGKTYGALDGPLS